MSEKAKDIIIRVVATFVEAFLSTFAIGISTLDFTSWDTAKAGVAALVIGAGAAACSAVWNYIRHAIAGNGETE